MGDAGGDTAIHILFENIRRPVTYNDNPIRSRPIFQDLACSYDRVPKLQPMVGRWSGWSDRNLPFGGVGETACRTAPNAFSTAKPPSSDDLAERSPPAFLFLAGDRYRLDT